MSINFKFVTDGNSYTQYFVSRYENFYDNNITMHWSINRLLFADYFIYSQNIHNDLLESNYEFSF